MTKSNRLIRFIIMGILLVAIFVIGGAYYWLSSLSISDRIKAEVELCLSDVLNVDISMDSIIYKPFDNIKLNNLCATDSLGDTILFAKNVEAQVSVYKLLKSKELDIDNVTISDFVFYLNKKVKDKPLNIQPIIYRIKTKNKSISDKSKESRYTITVHELGLRGGIFNYDLYYMPPKPKGVFDANHIHVYNINSDIEVSTIKSDNIIAKLKSLEAKEHSGLQVNDMSLSMKSTKDTLFFNDVNLYLPKSELHIPELKLVNSQIKRNVVMDSMRVNFHLKDTHLCFNDISPLYPKYITKQNYTLNIDTHISGKIYDFKLTSLELTSNNQDIALSGNFRFKNITLSDSKLECDKMNFSISNRLLSETLNKFTIMSPLMHSTIKGIGKVSFVGSAIVQPPKFSIKGLFTINQGRIFCNAKVVKKNDKTLMVNSEIKTRKFALGKFLNKLEVGNVALDVKVDITKPYYTPMTGYIIGDFPYIQYKDKELQNLSLSFDLDKFIDFTIPNKHNLLSYFKSLKTINSAFKIRNLLKIRLTDTPEKKAEKAEKKRAKQKLKKSSKKYE